MRTRQPSFPALIGNKYTTRRALLNAVATLPFAPLAARAQNSDSLWDSAMIMIGSGGTLIGTDRVQCARNRRRHQLQVGGSGRQDASQLPTSGSQCLT